MFTKIYNIFISSNLDIISYIKLSEYITFCINHNMGSKIKGLNAHHHILPHNNFSIYSNLSTHKWNGSYLSFSDHYIAHSLLAEAINDYSIISAWYAMNNKSYRQTKHISPNDLIGHDTHQKLMEIRTQKHIENMNKLIIDDNGNEIRFINDINTKSAQKMAIPYWDESQQQYTTIIKERSKKIQKTLTTMYWDESQQQYTTIAKERAKQQSERCKLTTTRYNVYRDTILIYENLTRIEIINISQTLLKTSKDKPMGITPQSKANLIRCNKEHLIGYYIEQIASKKMLIS